MGDRWTDRLTDYIDGELGPAEQRDLAAHLAGCPDCTQVLAELRRVVNLVGSLQDVPPADDLWPGIESRLGPPAASAETAGMLHLPVRRRQFSFTMPQLAAAGITLVVASSLIVWLVVSRPGASGVSGAGATVAAVTSHAAPGGGGGAPASAAPASAAEASGPAAGPAVGDRAGSGTSRLAQARESGREPRVRDGGTRFVRAGAGEVSADRQYNRAVADLEALLRRERSRLQPETVKAVEKSLSDIDRAIADARRALASDPADPYLNDHLAESMRAKLQLLRQTTALTQS